MTQRPLVGELPYPREIAAILIDPDRPGELVRVQNDHDTICAALGAHNTEACFLTNTEAIAWLGAAGGEPNLVAHGFIEAIDGPRRGHRFAGPVLLVGLGDDGYSSDVPVGMIAAARVYGILQGPD